MLFVYGACIHLHLLNRGLVLLVHSLLLENRRANVKEHRAGFVPGAYFTLDIQSTSTQPPSILPFPTADDLAFSPKAFYLVLSLVHRHIQSFYTISFVVQKFS